MLEQSPTPYKIILPKSLTLFKQNNGCLQNVKRLRLCADNKAIPQTVSVEVRCRPPRLCSDNRTIAAANG